MYGVGGIWGGEGGWVGGGGRWVCILIVILATRFMYFRGPKPITDRGEWPELRFYKVCHAIVLLWPEYGAIRRAWGPGVWFTLGGICLGNALEGVGAKRWLLGRGNIMTDWYDLKVIVRPAAELQHGQVQFQN